MPWISPNQTRHKSPVHRIPFYNQVHRQSRKRFVKIILLGLFAVGLWYTFQSACHFRFTSENGKRRMWSSKDSLFGDNTNCGCNVNNPPPPAVKASIGTVHALFGEPNPGYERALALRETHSKLQNHPMFVLREKVLTGLWSKPAWILAIIVQELSKPEGDRLKWLMWVDADVVIMNQEIPLDFYIPPSPEFDYLNLLVTHDRHGLNNGVFLIKVNSWSVRMLSAVIAFPSYRPEVELKYTEQSGLEKVIEDPSWAPRVQQVPQWWFNAYPGTPKPVMKPHEFRAGALQIHFASNRDGKRPERMSKWMAIAEQQLPEWNKPFESTTLPDEMRTFWADVSKTRVKPIARTDEVDTFWDLKSREKTEEFDSETMEREEQPYKADETIEKPIVTEYTERES